MARKKTIKEEAKVGATKPKSKRVMLTDTIQDLYFKKGYSNDDIPWTILMSQVKTMEREHGLSDDDIRQTINYMVTFEDIDISDADTLGLVPFYVDRCRKYIVQYKENKRKANEFEFDDTVRVLVKDPTTTVNLRQKNETFD